MNKSSPKEPEQDDRDYRGGWLRIVLLAIVWFTLQTLALASGRCGASW